MQNIAQRLSLSLFTFTALTLCAAPSFAQAETMPPASESESESATPATDAPAEDEVIAFGTTVTGQHDGMDAFFRGDFETAEIEFEQEFKGLRRFERARESAAEDAALSTDRAQAQADAGSNVSASANSRGGGTPSQSASSALSANSGVTSNFVNRRGEGRSILTDGKVTYEDFGFTRYMSGLSEIKLGKFDEAKTSLKQSLRYDESNYDARMRLGLLYLMDSDFEKAAKQLEKIDKQRRRCERLSCDNAKTLREATLVLAKELTRIAEAS